MYNILIWYLYVLWELDYKESWVLKNWCFWMMVLEKTLESPLDCKEIQPVHSEGDQPWDFFEKNDAKAETPVLWPPHAKTWLIGKDSDAGRHWGQEEKGTTEDEMAGWHHGLDGCESEWPPGDGDGQGGLACCDSWGRKESDTTERLNWTELKWTDTLIHKARELFSYKIILLYKNLPLQSYLISCYSFLMLLEHYLYCVFQFLLIYKCKKKRIKVSQEVILTNLSLFGDFCKYLARIIHSHQKV